jgi:hypothetical protein
VPVDADELEGWLELELNELRQRTTQGTVRLSRLTQELPDSEIAIGWLIELDVPDWEPLVEPESLAEALRDMRLLGLQPTLLAPLDVPASTSRNAPVLALDGATSNGDRP